MNFLLLLSLFLSFLCFAKCTLVSTKEGVLEGQAESSRGGRTYYAFYGIPYAAPPVDDLRFEDPVPPQPWQGVRDASVLPPPCCSPLSAGVQGEEDCLYLNVYTPKVSKEASMPVMVFVYGGRYMYGHALPSRYGPQYFMDKDVVLITFHYRIGPLGFLSTEDEVIPGNYGLKDLIAVLKWVQNNIESFGGDKSRVTVLGGSSGGTTSNSLLVSPLAKGLFHRCISQSGYFVDIPEYGFARRQAWKLASFVGCQNENITTSVELKSCFKKIPVQRLADSSEKLFTFGHLLPLVPFSPVIENEKVTGAYLVDHPSKLLQRNIDIPWILGINSDDGGMMSLFAYFNPDPDYNVLDKLVENYHEYFPKIFGYEHLISDAERLHEVTEIIKKYYFKDNIRANPLGFSKLYTIRTAISLRKAIELYKGPKYVYYYDHRNKDSFAKMYGDSTEDMGVIHGDELISMFNWSEVITPVTEGIDFQVSERIINLWTNFAAFGDPNGNQERIWTPVESDDIDHLYIKDGIFEMRKGILSDEHEFLKRLLGADS